MLVLDEKHFNSYRDTIDEAIESAGYDQMKGFCYDCGDYFDVDHIDDDGIYFSEMQGN